MAKPIYSVILKAKIGRYEGMWDGNEPQWAGESEILVESESRAYIEAFYKRLRAEKVSTPNGE